MYNLRIEAQTKSKAKLLGIPVPQYVFGKNFEVFYVIRNEGDQPSPAGRFTVRIKWQGTDLTEEKIYNIPNLQPGISHYTHTQEWGVLSHIGTFHIIDIVSTTHNELILHTTSGQRLVSKFVFHAIFGTTPEGVFEFWALIVSAFGLGIIAIEKIIDLLTLFFPSLPFEIKLIFP